MLSFKLALRNLCRNRLRTLITFLGISLSLGLVQVYHNFTTGVYSYMVECGVRSGAGHIAVMRQGYLKRRAPELVFEPGSLPTEIAALTGVKTVIPRLHMTGLAQTGWGSRRISLVGTDMPEEATSNPFLKDIPPEIFAKGWAGRSALVGERLVKELKIGVGRPLIITVQSLDGEMVSERFKVRGVIRSGIRDVDRSLVMVSRKAASEMAGAPGQVNELSVVLDGADLQGTVMPQVNSALAPYPELTAAGWETTMPNLYSAIRWDYAGGIVLSTILLLIVTFGVTNTLLMSVMERLKEFGMIRGIGASGSLIRRMILAEALVLGAWAALAGSAIASLATWYLTVYGFDLRYFIPENLEFGGVIFSALLYARWDVPWMIRVSVFMVLLCLVASLYPALKASRVTPVAALRHN
ncbi:FtsX-like permease family protein [uncultured Pseudodesulfovibrio sp.]|uniref:ABC transporter permease n=1 Tax=uncultured Pseudodesulfovibrio sp. TaxID=2035858 RepID=UPI0029C6148C|nr:FtsX-like permease family protein [uncultured Pseudodesulfovibrio sp.]